jgi:hypothetical protein
MASHPVASPAGQLFITLQMVHIIARGGETARLTIERRRAVPADRTDVAREMRA